MLILIGILTPLGLYLLIKSIKNSRRIFYGLEPSTAYLIKNALLTGISTSILFIAMILILSMLEGYLWWTKEWVMILIALAIVGGVFVFLGACIHFSTVNRYRETVFKKAIRENETAQNKLQRKD